MKKLTKQDFVDGFELEEIEMQDLKDFATDNGLPVDKLFIQGRGKKTCCNMLIDWVEQQEDATDTETGNAGTEPDEPEFKPVAPAPTPTPPPAVKPVEKVEEPEISAKEEVPESQRRSSGRNERPVGNPIGKDTGSNYVNRRTRAIQAKKGKLGADTDDNNEDAAKTSYIARRLRSQRPTKKGNN